LEGLTVKGEASWRHSRVRDPATGLYRRIVGGQTVGGPSFAFTTMSEITYDMPQRNLQLGVTVHDHLTTQEYEYRIDEISTNYHAYKIGLFAEYKPTPVWTMRIFGRDLAQTSAFRNREVYAGLRGSAPLSFIERRILNNGAVYGFNVQHDL